MIATASSYLFRMLIVLAVGMTPMRVSPPLTKYTFVVSGTPTEKFFQPLMAEMSLTSKAVSAGRARGGQVEAVVFGGGSQMLEANRLTLFYLDPQYFDLTVTLSEDRKTITSILARLRQDGSPVDHWRFVRDNDPAAAELKRIVGTVTAHSVTLDAPGAEHVTTVFNGEWQQRSGFLCGNCR